MTLSQNQLEKFQKDGFLVIDHVLSDEDLIPLEIEYLHLFQDIARDYFKKGKVQEDFSNLSFEEGYCKLVSAYPDSVDRFNISLPLINSDIDPDRFHVHAGPAVFGLLTNHKILDIVETFIGPDISSSPVQQMRLKPPQQKIDKESIAHSNVGLTTWHQDTVAVLPEADSTNQVTVWVAVTDADIVNGCLVSIAGSHKEGAHRHVPGLIPREPTVPEEIIAGRSGTPLPVKRGGIIVFHKQNIHCSLPNHSDQLRWSVDIRYHPVSQLSGRPAFPGFVARSSSQPELELHDPFIWNQSWREARQRLIDGKYYGKMFRDWE